MYYINLSQVNGGYFFINICPRICKYQNKVVSLSQNVNHRGSYFNDCDCVLMTFLIETPKVSGEMKLQTPCELHQ